MKKKVKEKIAISVCVVSGKEVRDKIDVDFTMGGHHLAHDYIPDSEVWIDDDDLGEYNETLVHEVVEWFVMKHLGISYEDAHEFAKGVEEQYRELRKATSGKKKVKAESLASQITAKIRRV